LLIRRELPLLSDALSCENSDCPYFPIFHFLFLKDAMADERRGIAGAGN